MRRARRQFVRTHHPDRGGDPVLFADGLRRFDALAQAGKPDDAGGAAPPEPCRPVTVLRRPRGISGWARHLSGRLLIAAGRPGQPPRVH